MADSADFYTCLPKSYSEKSHSEVLSVGRVRGGGGESSWGTRIAWGTHIGVVHAKPTRDALCVFARASQRSRLIASPRALSQRSVTASV